MAINLSHSTYTGNYKTLEAVHCNIIGDHLNVSGVHNTITGSHNTVSGVHNRIYGNDNDVSGAHCKVVGDDNIMSGAFCKATGSGNTVSGAFSVSQRATARKVKTYRTVVYGLPHTHGARRASVVVNDQTFTLDDSGRLRQNSVSIPDVHHADETKAAPPTEPDSTSIAITGFGSGKDTEVDDDKDEKTCNVCLTHAPRCCVLPCRHVTMCCNCTLELITGAGGVIADKNTIECPSCRQGIEEVMAIFV